MAQRPRRSQSRSQGTQIGGDDLKPGVLISLRADSIGESVAALVNKAGLQRVAYAEDFTGAADTGRLQATGMTVFANIGVAVADVDPDQEVALASLAGEHPMIAAVEAEPIFFAFQGATPEFTAYLRGYRDAVNYLYDKAFGAGASQLCLPITARGLRNDQETTWGLKAINLANSSLSGKGVRIAVLDTGLDLEHPDFRGRSVTHASFIPGQTVQDENGHGTHCIGTACGPSSPTRGPRYGIAHEAELFVGKVLTNQGSALARSTLAGIEWAVRNRCHVISMSLGALVLQGQRYLQAFETTAQNALKQNALIIAAAGNDSRRSQGKECPVSSPANCPSIMAVAAVDPNRRVADFSNSAINPDASVDIAGPGVDIYSSAPEPAAPPQPPRFRQWAARYDTISGTSMATPHVAGVAALLREANPDISAGALWRLLVSKADPSTLAARDVGAGLVQI